jgi:hypothetical protein
MNLYLYQKRVLALEKRFDNARRQLDRLQEHIRYNPDAFSKESVKCQLDAFRLLVRTLKDETAFYIKLGQIYDYVDLARRFFDLLMRRDPQLLDEILLEIGEQYNEEEDPTEEAIIY